MGNLPIAPIRVGNWFQGPRGSGQGGFTAQRFADAVTSHTGEAVTVAIKAPIPLDTDLDVVQRGADWHLIDRSNPDDDTILIATSWSPDVPDTAAVNVADAAIAGAGFPLRGDHPVPVCFSCGLEPDSMHVMCGPLPDGRYASDWTVPHWAIGDHGRVDSGALWAAIDCAQAWYVGLAGGRRHGVTVQIAVDEIAPITAGTYSLVSWHGDYPAEWDGRKRGACGAVFAADGTCVAKSRTFWIAIDEPEKA